MKPRGGLPPFTVIVWEDDSPFSPEFIEELVRRHNLQRLAECCHSTDGLRARLNELAECLFAGYATERSEQDTPAKKVRATLKQCLGHNSKLLDALMTLPPETMKFLRFAYCDTDDGKRPSECLNDDLSHLQRLSEMLKKAKDRADNKGKDSSGRHGFGDAVHDFLWNIAGMYEFLTGKTATPSTNRDTKEPENGAMDFASDLLAQLSTCPRWRDPDALPDVKQTGGILRTLEKSRREVRGTLSS